MALTNACAEPARIDSADSIEQASNEKIGRMTRSCLQGINVERSTVRGIARSAAFMTAYFLAFLATASAPGWFPRLIGSVVIFLCIFHLAMIGHDAGHGSLTRSAVLNRWLGRLVFLTSYVPYTAWLAAHHALHHSFTNLRGKDPVWTPLSIKEFDALSPPQRALERFYRTLAGVGLYNFVLSLRTLLFPGAAVLAHVPRRSVVTVERLSVFGFFGAQIGTVLAWQQFLERRWEIPSAPVAGLVAAILLPFAIMNWWTGLNSFLHHTHPQIRWYAHADEWRRAQVKVECTMHLIAPWPLGWLLGNSLEHTAHHVAPKVADTEVLAIQDQLEAALPEVIQKVKLTDCLRILAFCKLYDYKEHCWLDFAGQRSATPQWS